MTIPTVVAKTQEKVNTAKLQKAYSTLENAFRLAVQENGTPENWNSSSVELLNTIAPYLNLLKNCENKTGCLPDVLYKDINGTGNQNLNQNTGTAKLQLADGSFVMYLIHSKNCEVAAGSTKMLKNSCGDIWVDINGMNGPNMYGKDMFLFWVTKYGIVPFGTQAETIYSFDKFCKNIKSTIGQNGVGCAAWVLYNENMDYLHCADLNWSTKTSCK